MNRQLILGISFLITLFFTGCLYENPPSQPASQVDTWLIGTWITQDKSGKIYEAIISPETNTRYHVSFCNKDKNEKPSEFEGWISRVGNLKFLTLQSLSTDSRYRGKYLFLHYELVKREKAPFKGVGPCRIRIIQPELDASARTLDSYHLRQAIQENLQKGILLLPQGSVTWSRTGDITWPEDDRTLLSK